MSENQKTIFVTFVGAPNAGKSTLTNKMVGAKVSIVTPKVQTTRTRLTGIDMQGHTQIVMVDTPGIFKPQKQLDKSMVKAAWVGLQGADVMALLVDVAKQKSGMQPEVETIIAGMKQRGGKHILLLNKVDKVDKKHLLELTKKFSEMHDFLEIFMISALTGDGVDGLKEYLVGQAREEPWPYDPEQISDLPMRMYAAEVTREKLMMKLDQELPYQLMVDTEQWQEKEANKKAPSGSVVIHQTIYVMTESQKKIIVGKGGSMIKQVGESVRKELSHYLQRPAHVFLFVKVKQNWQSQGEHYAMMGLEL